MDDREIVRLLQARDERAVSELDAKYGGLCRHIARNILGSGEDAEEIASDALYAVWRSVPPQDPENLLAYTARIARNAAITRLRSKKREARTGEALLAGAEIAPDSAAAHLEAAETARCINVFLHSRPEREQILFVRRYFMGDSVERIAQDLGEPRARVSDTLYKLKRRLRKILQEEDIIL